VLEDPAALKHTFPEVVTVGLLIPGEIQILQKGCLEPGWYSTHIGRWLS